MEAMRSSEMMINFYQTIRRIFQKIVRFLCTGICLVERKISVEISAVLTGIKALYL
jgi:hypothetical protein